MIFSALLLTESSKSCLKVTFRPYTRLSSAKRIWRSNTAHMVRDVSSYTAVANTPLEQVIPQIWHLVYSSIREEYLITILKVYLTHSSRHQLNMKLIYVSTQTHPCQSMSTFLGTAWMWVCKSTKRSSACIPKNKIRRSCHKEFNLLSTNTLTFIKHKPKGFHASPRSLRIASLQSHTIMGTQARMKNTLINWHVRRKFVCHNSPCSTITVTCQTLRHTLSSQLMLLAQSSIHSTLENRWEINIFTNKA